MSAADTGPGAVAGYPRVRARLRRVRHTPGVPPTEGFLTIWLGGRKFHVRDEQGRSFAEVVADVTAPRGFGVAATTMEDLMDAWRSARRPPDRGATELFGDLESGVAVVHEPRRDPWTTDVERIAPAAEQLLTNGREAALEPSGEATYLDRPCREYRSALRGEEDGVAYRSDVTWLVSGPYVLVRDVRDSRIQGLRARTEVVELEEDGFDDAMLRP